MSAQKLPNRGARDLLDLPRKASWRLVAVDSAFFQLVIQSHVLAMATFFAENVP